MILYGVSAIAFLCSYGSMESGQGQRTNDVKSTLGAFVAARRLALGYNQEELSLKIGAEKNYISQLETGRIKGVPKADRLNRLASALDVHRDDLLAAAGKLPVNPANELATHLSKLANIPDLDEREQAFQALPQSLRQAIDELVEARLQELLRQSAERRMATTRSGHDQ